MGVKSRRGKKSGGKKTGGKKSYTPANLAFGRKKILGYKKLQGPPKRGDFSLDSEIFVGMPKKFRANGYVTSLVDARRPHIMHM